MRKQVEKYSWLLGMGKWAANPMYEKCSKILNGADDCPYHKILLNMELPTANCRLLSHTRTSMVEVLFYSNGNT